MSRHANYQMCNQNQCNLLFFDRACLFLFHQWIDAGSLFLLPNCKNLLTYYLRIGYNNKDEKKEYCSLGIMSGTSLDGLDFL